MGDKCTLNYFNHLFLLQSAAYAARDWHYLVKKGLSLSISSMMKSIYNVQRVGDVLFDGYPDPLLTMAAKIPLLAKNKIPLMDKFGWFYGVSMGKTIVLKLLLRFRHNLDNICS